MNEADYLPLCLPRLFSVPNQNRHGSRGAQGREQFPNRRDGLWLRMQVRTLPVATCFYELKNQGWLLRVVGPVVSHSGIRWI